MPDYSAFYAANPNYEEGPGGVARLKGSGAPGFTPYGDLAKNVNTFNTSAAKQAFVSNLPDYENLVAKRSANTGAELRGEVPQDVVNQILQQAAERGIATGSPGSPNANASMLRSLGLTSLGMQQQGSKDLSQSISDTPVAPLFSPASMFPYSFAQDELGAARAGMNRGGTAPVSNWGGAPSTSSLRLPGGTLGSSPESTNWWNSNPSWNQPQGAAVGMLNSDTYTNGLYNAPMTGGFYDLPTGNLTGGGAGYGNGVGADYGGYAGAQYGSQSYGLGDDWSTMFNDLP